MAIEYVSSPIATDAFSRGMLEAYAEKPLFGVGFLTLFSDRQRYFTENDTTDIQIMRAGGVTMAPMVVRGVPVPQGDNRKPLNDKGWTEISRVFPLIERTATLTSDQLTKRVFGEAVYSGLTKKQRAIRLAAQKFADLEYSSLQTCEYLAAQSITTGKQVSLLEQTGDAIEYDFKRNSGNANVFANDWGTPSTATPDADLDAASDDVEVNGKAKADIALFGDTKFSEWQATTEFKTIINNRHKVNIRADFDEAAPAYVKKLVDAGFNFQFMYKTPKGRKLAILTYDHTTNPQNGGSPVRLLDTNKVIVLATNARRDAIWGPTDYFDFSDEKMRLYMDVFGINLNEMGLARAKFPNGFPMSGLYYDAYKTDNSGKGVEIRCQCAPIFCPVQTDAICVISES
jgi:hypothetical protein